LCLNELLVNRVTWIHNEDVLMNESKNNGQIPKSTNLKPQQFELNVPGNFKTSLRFSAFRFNYYPQFN
jgi:hypothetical protein